MSNIFMAEFPCRRIPLPQNSLAAEFPCHRIPVRNASPLIVKGMELKSQKCVKDFNHTRFTVCRKGPPFTKFWSTKTETKIILISC